MRRAPGGVIVVLGIAIFLAICALAMLAVSFATNHWVEVDVDRTQIDALGELDDSKRYQLPYYFSRDRGLFRTCYEPSGDAKFLDSAKDVVDGNCQLEQGYELKNNPDTDAWGSDYDTRKHLLRCHCFFFILALLLLIAACIAGLVGCWNVRVRLYLAAGVCCLAAALFTIGGMAIFHVYWKMENDDITIEAAGFPAYWDQDATHNVLQNFSSTTFGYSYYLGWISMALAIVAMVMFIGASWALKGAKEKEKVPIMDFAEPPARSYSYPGPKAMAQPMPTLLPPPMPALPPPMPMPMSQPMHMSQPMPMDDDYVPVVPVGPPMVPVVPVTELQNYAESTYGRGGGGFGGYDYDYPASRYM